MGAGQVAQRAGVEPQGIQRPQRDRRSGFALRGDRGIAEFRGIEALNDRRDLVHGVPEAAKAAVPASVCNANMIG